MKASKQNFIKVHWKVYEEKIKKIISKYQNTKNQLEKFFHPLVGVPSYQKYLEYHRSKKPGYAPKTQEEFYKDVLENRYGKNGKRGCC